MPECVTCCGPVAQTGSICKECRLERAFGTGDYPEGGDEA